MGDRRDTCKLGHVVKLYVRPEDAREIGTLRKFPGVWSIYLRQPVLGLFLLVIILGPY
jgi:hypothetical protein